MIADDVILKGLIVLGCTPENFLKATDYIHKIQKSIPGAESFSREEAQLAFFFGEPLLFLLARKEISSGEVVKRFPIQRSPEITEELSPMAYLIFLALNANQSQISFNDATTALYMMFGFSLPSYNHESDTDKRFILIKRFLGEDIYEKAFLEVKGERIRQTKVTLSFEKISEILKEKDIPIENYKKASSLLFKGIGEKSLAALKGFSFDELAFGVFSPFVEAYKLPGEKGNQEGSFLRQGNLDNLTYLIFAEVLEYNKSEEFSVQSPNMETYFFHKMQAIAALYNVSEPKHGDYVTRLFSILIETFGERTFLLAKDKMVIATNSMKGEQ